MQTLRLLQLGDLHFPDLASDRTVGDWKDEALSHQLAQRVLPDRMQNVIRAIHTLTDGGSLAFTVCGDITSRGDLDGYARGIDFLNYSLQLDDENAWDPDAIHAVPGNHDVDRDLCDADGGALLSKFEPLERAWNDIGLPVLTATGVRESRVGNDDRHLAIFAMNSCIGCGERRFLPGAIADEMAELLKDLPLSETIGDSINVLHEQIDTPAFLEDDLTKLCERMSGLGTNAFPIIVAHHNLLPQTAPRLQIYTELINSGVARARIASYRRPVMYLHGHVHADPVEVLTQSHPEAGKVVLVSAPMAVDGFNLIDIHFSRANRPIGTTIRPYRVQQHGGVSAQEPIRISLYCPGDELHPLARRVCSIIDFEKTYRFNEVRSLFHDQGESVPQRPTLQSAMLEAMWARLIVVDSIDDEARYWRVRRWPG